MIFLSKEKYSFSYGFLEKFSSLPPRADEFFSHDAEADFAHLGPSRYAFSEYLFSW